MKKYNAIITGGAGFIGSNLTERIINDYGKIYIIDNLIRTSNLRNLNHLIPNEKIELIKADISTYDFSYFNDKNISHLFHLAAPRINRCANYNEEGHNSIADGGWKVVDYCAINKIKLFFASAASVYQKPVILPIKENVACYPHTIYGSGKLYTENLIRSYDNMYGLDYTINRFFCVYGVKMDNEGVYTEVIFNWLNSIKNGSDSVTVFGNPDEKVLDLVYIDDVIDAILLTTYNSNKEVYNVSSEKGVTLSQLFNEISLITNVNLKIKLKSENRTDIELKRVGNINKLKKLGWNIKVELRNGIKKTWEWINNDY